MNEPRQGWARTVRLGDVADLNWGDTNTTKASYVDAGFIAYSASGPDGYLPWADYNRVGVVVSAIGAQCGKTWLARGQWSCIKNTLRLWSTDPEVSTEYLYWVTRDPVVWPTRGSAQPFISQGDARNVSVELPSLPQQRAIAEVLGALEDKIASNRRIVQRTLELIPLELASARTDEWMNLSLSSIAHFENGGAYTKDATGTGRMVMRIVELNGGPGESTIYNDIDVPDEKLARVGDVLMSWSGSLGVYYWVRPEAIINQHIFKVICSAYPTWLVYSKITEVLPEFRQIAADKATTMGHIKRHHLDEAKVAVPSSTDVLRLDAEIGPLWSRLISAEVESLTLASFRDTLIPEVLSGRISVPESNDLIAGSV